MPSLTRTVIALVCACLVATCAAPSGALSGGPPAEAVRDPLPTPIDRASALAAVRASADLVGRIDQMDAKLMTWKEYTDIVGAVGAVNADPKASPHVIGTMGFMGDPEMRIVWIVAVSGEVWPQFRIPVSWGGPPNPTMTPNPPYRWGLFMLDAARGGRAGVVEAGMDDAWPPALFTNLPDHPAALGAAVPVDPCATLAHIPDVAIPSRFPARTLAELTANLPQDFGWLRLLQDIAGVRSNPMQDSRVPHCRIEQLRMGTPSFARAYPAANGAWFVPVMYQDRVVLTTFVDVDASGIGWVGGDRGGAVPIPSEADARGAATLPNDPVMSAELVLARPPGCGATPTAVWRLVRASGIAVYFALDVYGATPPGVLIEEKDMRFSGTVSPRAASLARAC